MHLSLALWLMPVVVLACVASALEDITSTHTFVDKQNNDPDLRILRAYDSVIETGEERVNLRKTANSLVESAKLKFFC
ncbi:secreted RxLR effector peptide protein, putative [Phytophthora infestans T30-4]|uniref:Secreted RxLR effector peptide protein, putative n=1 Tax=Phytophthora infestans (strain T30-4) TaxID=403677 RepID=D0P4W7_PHYIT|nr:secreted RxLR effector peptide protein, putative [Phytophthora infestans T30-4]EEY53714.1 secreted RxLR effector peptide protein, putative [Phytophthora infestans T30-4]|eukprot:XP_002894731.1 secreted RxLR effector peptide protein, putative [Phytophthora infestans T30-4]